MGPLGKYSQIVAAIVSIGVIATALALRAFGTPDTFADNLALLAAGAIFGSFAAVNGIKPAVSAAHKRMDAAGIPPADEIPEGANPNSPHEGAQG